MLKSLYLIICFVFLSITVLMSCQLSDKAINEFREVKTTSGTYWGITAAQLSSIMESDNNLLSPEKEFILINVHYPYEGEIIGTDLFLPFDKIEGNLENLPENKTTKIILYCKTGSMSVFSARKLLELGFNNILHLDHGMMGWERDGLILIHDF